MICPNCGAPLPEVPPSAAQSRCGYCSVGIRLDRAGLSLLVADEAEQLARAEAAAEAAEAAVRRRQMLQGLLDKASTQSVMFSDYADFRDKLLRHLPPRDQSVLVPQVVWALAEDFDQANKTQIRRDTLAMVRLTEGYFKVIDALSNAPSAELSLPFLTATPQGPLHFQRTLTAADLAALASPADPPPRAGRSLWQRLFGG